LQQVIIQLEVYMVGLPGYERLGWRRALAIEKLLAGTVGWDNSGESFTP
jgi:hypothetical protein